MTWARTGQPGTQTDLPGTTAAGQHERQLTASAAYLRRPGQAIPVWAVVSAGLSPVLMVGGWLAAAALQPATYNPIRQTVSVLADHGGTDRWVMTSVLFAVGGSHLVTAAGLARLQVRARILLILSGLCAIGIAACPEPTQGPTPQHLAWTALGAVTITVWPAFTTRRAPPRPPILSIYATTVVTAAFIGLLGWLVAETQDGNALGLAERLTEAIQDSWPFIIALSLRRTAVRTRRPGQRRPLSQGAGGVRKSKRSARRSTAECTACASCTDSTMA